MMKCQFHKKLTGLQQEVQEVNYREVDRKLRAYGKSQTTITIFLLSWQRISLHLCTRRSINLSSQQLITRGLCKKPKLFKVLARTFLIQNSPHD